MKKWLWLVMVLGAASAYAAPQILGIVEQAYLGPWSEFRCTIATDGNNQPHIVSTEGAGIHFYDKVGGAWRVESANSGALFGSAQYGNPHMEIVSGNRAWVGGVLFGGRFGIGVIVRDNMATAPTPVGSAPRAGVRVSPGEWDAGNISTDPARPNECVVSSMAGYYKVVGYNGRWYDVSSGQMYAGEGGEKNAFHVSKAGNVAHADGSHAVWHGAIGGYYGYWSAYRNSLMSGPVTWAAEPKYPAQNDDGSYVYVVGDSKNGRIGYIVAAYAGIVMNIWNGSSMRYPVNNLLVVDPLGGATARRYAPQLAPAKGGGVWVFYQRGGTCMLRYVGQDGSLGQPFAAASGAVGAVAVDSRGDVHIAYATAAGMNYRKIDIAGGGTGVLPPADFDGDGGDDQAVFDEGSGRWYALSISNNVVLWNRQHGYPGVTPLPGQFAVSRVRGTVGDPDELAVFDGSSARWYIVDVNNVIIKWGMQWGYAGVVPLVGDFNGDDQDDVAVFDPTNGRWYIRTLDGQVLAWNLLHGYAGCIPLTADFNNDGEDDLAVFDPTNGRWYIRTKAGEVLAWKLQHGYAGCIPLAADFNGDGSADLAVFDPTNGRWFILSLQGGILAWNLQHGYQGVIPVAADFDADGIADLGVYDQAAGGKWFIRTLAGAVLRWNHQHGSSSMIPLGGSL